MKRLRWFGCGIGLVLLGAAGCGVAADAVNPSLLSSLGFDPFSVGGGQGSVIVLLRNNSSFPAVMFFATAADSSTLGTRQGQTVVLDSGESENQVFTCPISYIRAGLVGAGNGTASDAACVFDQTDPTMCTTAQYGGSGVASGDFGCGDVVVITLTGPDVNGDYFLSMRVVPGQ